MLSGGQQHILEVMERDLCATDPELVMSFAALIPDRRRPPAPQQEGPGKPGRWTLLVLVLATMAGGLMIVLLGG